MFDKLAEHKTQTVRWLVGLLLVPGLYAVFTGLVWAMDAHIQEQMGTVVEDQMDRREIQYLQFQKRTRSLTEQERRDLEYYQEQLRLRQLGKDLQ